MALLIASPALQQLIVYPSNDKFTEFWLYGPNYDGNYPSNVTADQPIRLYIDGANHLGEAAKYQVEIKFRNITQSGPDSFNYTHSTLAPIETLTALAADNGTFELPIDISFQYNLDPKNSLQIDIYSITINAEVFPVNQTTIDWSIEKAGFYGNIFFELWLYSSQSGTFEYHQRYVGLWLNFVT